MISLLNITKVEKYACAAAANLVAVDIHEGVKSIGFMAFHHWDNLTTVYFPRTLTSISSRAFYSCYSLDNVDLLHTNLQELGARAFAFCSELKTMTIPDSLKTLGIFVLDKCSKLVPSSIDANDFDDDVTDEVVDHLRSQ